MADTMRSGGGWNSRPWRIAAWSVAAGLMLLPVMASLATGGTDWSNGDFVFVAVVLFGSCFLFDLAARKAPNFPYLAGAGCALAAGFGLIVVNGAVGLVGSEDEAHNLWFGAAILVAITGALIARGRSEGMARAMFAAAITHIAVSAALLIGAGGVAEGGLSMEIVGLAGFAAMWLTSAALIHYSAR